MRLTGRSILELREAKPDLFYSQTWYVREPFMRELPSNPLPVMPTRLVHRGLVPKSSAHLMSAVDLIHLYLQRPADPLWEFYLWTSDTDTKGQRVYVGGVDHAANHGIEIHRNLSINMQWGIPA